MYRLFEAHFNEVKGQWEERIERRYGFWGGLVDEQVRRYLDCGLFESGFARIRCPDCAEEYLLAFSWETVRELMCAAWARHVVKVHGTFMTMQHCEGWHPWVNPRPAV